MQGVPAAGMHHQCKPSATAHLAVAAPRRIELQGGGRRQASWESGNLAKHAGSKPKAWQGQPRAVRPAGSAGTARTAWAQRTSTSQVFLLFSTFFLKFLSVSTTTSAGHSMHSMGWGCQAA